MSRATEFDAILPSTPSREPACAVPGTPLAGARAGLDACVHCGFCLQSCPTYTTLEDENDSPRGRILLMRAVLEGDLPPGDEAVNTHISRCLGCRACETACPSGVPYGWLLEATRATLADHHPKNFVARAFLAIFAHPRLLAIAMWGSRVFRATGIPRLLARLGGRVGFASAMLASTAPVRGERRYEAKGSGARGRVAFLKGCVMEGLLHEANRSTERVLQVNDYALVDAPGQRCCGALHAHGGDLETARELARRNIEAFERSGAEYIVTNSAGCGAMMKEYGHLLAEDRTWHAGAEAIARRVRDVSELLAAAGPKPGGAVEVRVTYDAPCHLLHAQRVATPPLQLLRAIPGLELVPLPDADRCCGAAGIYSLIEPEVSNAVLDRKVADVAGTGATLVATGNPGCLMQIGAGLIREGAGRAAIHPVELLDESYARQSSRKE